MQWNSDNTESDFLVTYCSPVFSVSPWTKAEVSPQPVLPATFQLEIPGTGLSVLLTLALLDSPTPTSPHSFALLRSRISVVCVLYH